MNISKILRNGSWLLSGIAWATGLFAGSALWANKMVPYLEIDPQLNTALIEILDSHNIQHPFIDKLTQQDMLNLPEHLNLRNKGIVKIDGLEMADNVKCLDLSHNKISGDILPLIGMNNLEAVSLAHNELDFKNSKGIRAASRALKSSLVFVDEGVDTQEPITWGPTIVDFGNEHNTVTIPTQEGVYYRIIAREGRGDNSAWKTVDVFKADGDEFKKELPVGPTAYQVERLSSPYLTDTADNPRYLRYLKNLASSNEKLEAGWWNGLWFTDDRNWYHERAEYIYCLIGGYKEGDSATEEAAKDAFRLRQELRSQARLLMGNQWIANYFLPSRDADFDNFFKSKQNRLSKNNQTITDEAVYADIIRSATTSNESFDSLVGWADSVVNWLREYGPADLGLSISPRTDYVPLEGEPATNN